MVVGRDVPGLWQLRGDVDGPALGQELMQSEGEERPSRPLLLGSATGHQRGPQCRRAGRLVLTRQVGECGCRRLHGGRRATDQPPGGLLFRDAERVLDPRRQRILHQRGIRHEGLVLDLPPRPDGRGEIPGVGGANGGRPNQALDDHPLGYNLGAENARGDGGDISLLVRHRCPAGHRR